MDERSERLERRFELPVIIAALLVIPVIVIEESSFGQPWDAIGVALNWGTWFVFLAEAVVMLSVVPNRGAWLRRHPIDVAVVILTPPFLAAFAGARLLRLLRLLRLAPLARHLFTQEGLRYSAALALLTAIAGGAAFTYFEEEDYTTAEGVYWALTTMTTVGSEIDPTTTASQTLAVIVVLMGVAFVAVLTGAVAERFFSRDLQAEEDELQEDIDDASAAILHELRGLRTRLADLEVAVQRRARP